MFINTIKWVSTVKFDSRSDSMSLKFSLNVVSLVSLFAISIVVNANETEAYPVVDSNSILTSEYLSSTNHRVESVGIDNGFYHFTVESDIGNFDIHSLALFKKRVNEIRTISRAITQYEQQDNEFSGELRSQLRITGDSAVDLLTSPLNTASSLAGQLAGNLNATLAGEDSFIYHKSKQASYEPKDATTATHKRNIAFQLGIDLYTDNVKVQSFLNTVANARSSGKISAGIGLSNGLINIDEMDLKIQYLIKNKTLSELDNHNREWLSRMGINTLLIEKFIAQPILSPSNKTVITSYLSELVNVSRLNHFIELVLTSNNKVSALMYEQLSKTLWRYNKGIEKIDAFYNYDNQAAVITESGKIVFFETTDLLIWSELNQAHYKKLAEHAVNSGYNGWEVVSFGEFSTLANKKMGELNFKQHTMLAH